MGDSLITALILAVVALSESVRRLSHGEFVLRRDAFGPWRLARTFELGTGLHLLAWCVPYTLPLVLSPATSDGRLGVRRLVKRIETRARRVRADLAMLRVIGLLVLVVVVLGIPFGIHRWGGWGLIMVLQLLLILTFTQTTIAWMALRRVGLRGRAALAASVRFLWPFSAPQAAGAVQERIVAGVPGLVAAHALLGEEEFLTTYRSMVYDALRLDGSHETNRVLELLVSRSRQSDFVRSAPAGSNGNPFCPRCAMVYREGIRECSDCEGVALGRL